MKKERVQEQNGVSKPTRSAVPFEPTFLAKLESKLPQEFDAGEIDQLTHIFQNTIDQQLNGILHFDGFFDKEIMQKAVFLSYYMESILGSRFIVTPKKAFWRRREDLLTQISCEFIQVEDDVERAIFRFITSPIDPRKELPLKVVFFRTKTNDILCLKASHEALDGTAVKEYLKLLSFLYSKLKEDPFYCPPVNGATNRSLKQIFQNLSLLQRLGVLLHLRAGKAVNSLPWKTQKAQNRRYEIILFTREQFRKIKALSKKMRISITDFIITAFHRVIGHLAHFSPGKKVLSTITVNLRVYLPENATTPLCNLTSSANVYSRYRPDERIEKTLVKITKAMRKKKKRGIGLGSALFCKWLFKLKFKKAEKILEKRIANQLQSNSTFPVITNVGLTNPSDFAFSNLTLKDAYIIPPFIKAPVFMMGALTFDEKLSFSIGYFEESYDSSLIRAFLEQMKEEMLSLAAISL